MENIQQHAKLWQDKHELLFTIDMKTTNQDTRKTVRHTVHFLRSLQGTAYQTLKKEQKTYNPCNTTNFCLHHSSTMYFSSINDNGA